MNTTPRPVPPETKVEIDFTKLRVPPELRKAAQDVIQDRQTRRVTVRELLRWFGAERRGKWVVADIRVKLRRAKLMTSPDFESPWIGGTVRLIEAYSKPPEPMPMRAQSDAGPTESAAAVEEPGFRPADPAHQLSRLEAANKAPTEVSPNDSVEHAVTLMLTNDFSQLPVMTSDREVKGVISWKAIASRLHLGGACEIVRDCMDEHAEMPAYQSIFDAIKVIAEDDFVLVRDSEKRISGIVTAYDVSAQFNKLTEPFILLGDIENQIRNLIGSKFKKTELERAKDPGDEGRSVSSVEDLTFGEYLKLLENAEHWERLELHLDRKVFIKDLGKIRIIRNEVMHFDPDGISEDDLATLRKFARFLTRLSNVIKT